MDISGFQTQITPAKLYGLFLKELPASIRICSGMVDDDSNNAAAQTTSIEAALKPATDEDNCDSEQDDELGLKIDPKDPLAWINFWPG